MSIKNIIATIPIYLSYFDFQLIGRSVGQLFRKEVKIQDLPRLNFAKKLETKDVMPDLRDIFSA